MKILVVGDIHVCKQSSIITGNGSVYSKRLDNCIKSINWVEETAVKNNCDKIVYLGDFFDKPDLDSQTITAMKDIKWSSIPKSLIVGNHESEDTDLKCSSAKLLESANFEIINEPKVIDNIAYLPYVVEINRQALEQYIQGAKIVFSHNDIKGIQMGPIMSQVGFDVNEINAKKDFLFVNGHLHNGNKISNSLINLGILTGQNFGEDATKYAHSIMLLDTDTLKYDLIENPFAFNFYKITIDTESDLKQLESIKNQAVLSVSCRDTLIDQARVILEKIKDKLAAVRVITVRAVTANEAAEDITDLVMDHIAKFCECCKEKLDNTAILDAELAGICK